MATVFDQECPWCHGNAKYEFINHCVARHFKCPICGEFAIASEIDAGKIRRAGFPKPFAELEETRRSNKGEMLAIRRDLATNKLVEKGIDRNKGLAEYFY